MALTFRTITRSLAHRNYRLFFFGQLISLIGNWMTITATSWLVYRLTGSAMVLSALNAINLVPFLFIAPYAGALVDRWDKRTVLLVTQSASMLQSFALAVLTLSNTITVADLFALMAFQAVVNAFDLPARQALVAEVVESRNDVANAIALNSAIFNAARLVGPAVSGFIIAFAGEGVCFLLDGVSFGAVLAGLALMRLKSKPRLKEQRSAWGDLREGLAYAVRFEPILVLIALVGLASFSLAPCTVLLPIFARELLLGGPRTLGLLMAAMGLGALCSALYLASRTSVVGLGKLILAAGTVLGISLTLFAFSSDTLAGSCFLFFIGLSMILLTASSNTIIQTIVESSKRARVMSLFGTAFNAMMPLGSIFAGWSEALVGPRLTVAAGGVIMLSATMLFATRLPSVRRKIRPIYEDMGIITKPNVT